MAKQEIDLALYLEKMCVSTRYSHEYDSLMSVIEMLANSPVVYDIVNCPSCYSPLMMYLGHKVSNIKKVSISQWEFEGMDWELGFTAASDQRTFLEVACCTRPELIHALYMVDNDWACPMVNREDSYKSFIATSNGSYFRKEIREYEKALLSYESPLTKAILVPCSADKPYPSRLHNAVIEILERNELQDWDIIVLTGVLGLVPSDLWDIAPSYDAGIPNFEKIRQIGKRYFTLNKYDNIVVYSDFMAYAIHDVFQSLARKPTVEYIFGHYYRAGYENLMLSEHLWKLETTLKESQYESSNFV